jgi:hypothetical protein
VKCPENDGFVFALNGFVFSTPSCVFNDLTAPGVQKRLFKFPPWRVRISPFVRSGRKLRAANQPPPRLP